MLWRRKLVVVLTIIVAVGASVLYLKKNHPTYKSSAVVQVNPLPQGAQGSGVVIDTSLRFVTGPQVSAAAATLLHVSSASAIGATVTASQPSTGTTTSTNSAADVQITAATGSAGWAQQVADAYARAYVSVLGQQAQANIKAWQNQVNQAAAQLQTLGQQQTPTNPDPLITAKINNASGQFQTASQALAAAQHAPTIGAVVDDASWGATTRSSHKILFIAGIIGVLGGCGLALAWEQLDTRVRRSDDLEGSEELPLLAELPVDPDGRTNDRALPVLDKPHSGFAQAIRELRTSVQVLVPDVRCPVVVVTSPEPSDGKTFVASNLAVSWALTGKRTVVIAADLRRDHIDEVFSSTIPSEGLADYLAAGLERPAGAGTDGSGPAWSELLWQTDVDRLLLLPAGSSPRDPGDLLASPLMERTLAELRNEFDAIIIDTPPTLAVADSAILGSLADGIVVVVNAQGTNEGLLERTVRRLTAARGTVLGLVFNRSREAVNSSYRTYYAPNQRSGDDRGRDGISKATHRVSRGAVDTSQTPPSGVAPAEETAPAGIDTEAFDLPDQGPEAKTVEELLVAATNGNGNHNGTATGNGNGNGAHVEPVVETPNHVVPTGPRPAGRRPRPRRARPAR